MSDMKKTVFHDRHVSLGAKMVEFGRWEMPISYPNGTVEEHLATRRTAGLFDVSHMGRFRITGRGALRFLNHVLTNNVEALDPRQQGSQYTLIPTEEGGAVDDAYLYCFVPDEYLLVVNASNTEKDWEHLNGFLGGFEDVTMENVTDEESMLALQGPNSRAILEKLLDDGLLPEPMRNSVSTAAVAGTPTRVARTGYTGEPLGFELFVPANRAVELWDALVAEGAVPVGLGARDTLRLEAGLPLYGQDLGVNSQGEEMPLLSTPLAKVGLSFAAGKGQFVGRAALEKQFEAFGRIMRRDYSMMDVLPRMVRSVAVAGRGVARTGSKVLKEGKEVGHVTSGTMVPCCVVEGHGLESRLTDEKKLRSICLAHIDSDIVEDEQMEIEIRGKKVPAVVVPYHLRSEAPPFARPIIFDHEPPSKDLPQGDEPTQVRSLLKKSLENHVWRQKECINLIPSEMTTSPMTSLLSITDPSCRYAEHRSSKAFYDEEIFYYQGTDFIDEVERMLHEELCKFLGCTEVETRVISGQMANMAVFSAMVDYLNRTDRKSEPRRIARIMNNHIAKGGHLSAQPMGALRDFVARDPQTERPAVFNFPVLVENPFKIDVPKTLEMIDEVRPEFIIFGKSMVLHREPVAAVRRHLDDRKLDAVVMYDMAHVLGLVGPHFQEPFKEGADMVTGSTHKTFYGTQRGIIGGRFEENEERYQLWEAVQRRAFPGSTSNHHLGTLLGLLMACYEMNYFKDSYQTKVLSNAKAFAVALKDSGLDVAGDPEIDFTETHQVLVRVGYGRGPEIARRLEDNNIVCNYQAMPDEEGFTVAGGLRFGVSEMTRFGMEPDDFKELAGIIHDVVVSDKDVRDEAKALRQRFLDLGFCFRKEDYADLWQDLHELIG